MTLVSVLITVALFAFIFQFSSGWTPRHIMVKVHTVLTVIAPKRWKLKHIRKSHCLISLLLGIMVTFTFSMNHARNILMFFFLRNTSGSMTITGAGSSHNHVIDGVVVLFSDINCIHILKLLISKCMQLGKCNSKISGLEKVLDLLAVGVEARGVELDIWRQHSVDDFSLSGWSKTRVSGLTNNFTQ